MTDVNEMRCTASELIVRIMKADRVSAVDKEQQLYLLWQHASSAYEKITGEPPELPETSEDEKAQMRQAQDAYDAPFMDEDQKRLAAGNELTRQHIAQVRIIMMAVVKDLLGRAACHDDSKLLSPEAEVFAEFGPKLRGTTYDTTPGSVYMGFLEQMSPATSHHYAHNSHHPEHVPHWRCPECEGVFGESEVLWHEGYDDPYCKVCQGRADVEVRPHVTIDGMNLLDLLEMFCDWKAASLRHADGDIADSIVKNTKRFSLSPQIVRIMQNTVDLINEAAE